MIRIHLKICRSCHQSPGAQRAHFVRVSELSRSARENDGFTAEAVKRLSSRRSQMELANEFERGIFHLALDSG